MNFVFSLEVQIERWGISLKENFKISHFSNTIFEINMKEGKGKVERKKKKEAIF